MGLNAGRVALGTWPTALEPAPRLGAVLGVDDLWVKRDDLSGFAWGGNKVRAVETLLADIERSGAHHVIVSGGPTSNFAATMAAAAASRGLVVHQVSYGTEPSVAPPALAASRQAGARVLFTGSSDRSDMEVRANELAVELAEDVVRGSGSGHGGVYVIPRGGATAIGALGFFRAVDEVRTQLAALDLAPRRIVIPVGSGGSIAGLVAGSPRHGGTWHLDGVSVSRDPVEMRAEIRATAAACLARAGQVGPLASFTLHDGRAPGFGLVDPAAADLIQAVRVRTGLLVDDTYNAKALAWLAAAPPVDGPTLYWHTGGALGAAAALCQPHPIPPHPSAPPLPSAGTKAADST